MIHRVLYDATEQITVFTQAHIDKINDSIVTTHLTTTNITFGDNTGQKHCIDNRFKKIVIIRL